MELVEVEEIRREILKKYNKNPRRWQVLFGKDERGFFNFLILNPTEIWQIKLDTIYGKPLAVGGRIENEALRLPYKMMSFGFRKVGKKLMRKIMRDMMELGRISRESIEAINKIQPVPYGSIRGIGLEGPIINLPKLSYISEKQRELDLRLSTELRRMLRRRFDIYS